MVDITDPKGAKREIEQEAYRHYEQLSGTTLARRPDGTFQSQGHNDQLDAFRSACVYKWPCHPACVRSAVDRTQVWG